VEAIAECRRTQPCLRQGPMEMFTDPGGPFLVPARIAGHRHCVRDALQIVAYRDAAARTAEVGHLQPGSREERLGIGKLAREVLNVNHRHEEILYCTSFHCLAPRSPGSGTRDAPHRN